MSINKLGSAIQMLRTSRGLTQEQLADKTSMAKGSIAQIEQGHRSVSLDALDKIANALDVPSACLVILGSTPTEKSESVKEFLSALQNLVMATIEVKSVLGEGHKLLQVRPVVSATEAGASLKTRGKKKNARGKRLQHA